MTIQKPSETLRQALLKMAINNTAPRFRRSNHTIEELADGVANNLPPIIGIIADLDSSNASIWGLASNSLQRYAVDYGFDSSDALISAIEALKDELRQRIARKKIENVF